MAIFIRVETCYPEHSGQGLAFLDPELMERHHWNPGQHVEVFNQFGKLVAARLGTPHEPDRGEQVIRLDQFLRQSIKVSLGDFVEIQPVDLGRVRSIALAPLTDVLPGAEIEAFLVQQFAASGIPVSDGAVLYAKLPGSTAGSAFKVVEIEPAGGGVLTLETQLRLKHLFQTSPGVGVEVTFEDVGGLDREVRLLRELVELPLRFPEAYRQLGVNPPRGVILYGPPGAGKTHLARALANEMRASLYYINGPEIISSTYGETEANLRRIFQDASHHLPSIIFVDEIDVIAPKRGESGSQSDTRMVTQFLELLDGLKRVEGVMVIGTTNRIDAIDHSLRRPGRIDREVFVGPPDASGRLAILQIHSRGMPLADEARAFLPELARTTHGFVGADIMELCREAGLNALRRLIGDRWSALARMKLDVQQLRVERSDFRQALSRVRPSALREAVTSVPNLTWADVGGLDAVKQRLRETVAMPLRNPDVFRAMGVTLPPGVLLHGPPGTGKSLLARALASECQVNFMLVKGPEVFSKWLGESEEGIRNIFRVARQVAPCLVFFDQIDALAPRRSLERDSRAEERVVNQLMAELDAIEPLTGLFVLAATNRIDMLDPGLLQLNRFGTQIHVPLPDESARQAIVRIALRAVELDVAGNPESAIADLAARTAGFSGAEISAVCEEAKLEALRAVDFRGCPPVRLEHLARALQTVQEARARTQEPSLFEGSLALS